MKPENSCVFFVYLLGLHAAQSQGPECDLFSVFPGISNLTFISLGLIDCEFCENIERITDLVINVKSAMKRKVPFAVSLVLSVKSPTLFLSSVCQSGHFVVAALS